MKRETDLDGVKSVAKTLVMMDLHLTDYSPVIVQHPFTSSGVVAAPTENGITLLDITENEDKGVGFVGHHINVIGILGVVDLLLHKLSP